MSSNNFNVIRGISFLTWLHLYPLIINIEVDLKGEFDVISPGYARSARETAGVLCLFDAVTDASAWTCARLFCQTVKQPRLSTHHHWGETNQALPVSFQAFTITSALSVCEYCISVPSLQSHFTNTLPACKGHGDNTFHPLCMCLWVCTQHGVALCVFNIHTWMHIAWWCICHGNASILCLSHV